jgi:hypothetical protein
MSEPSGTFIVRIINRSEHIPYYVMLESDIMRYRARCYWRGAPYSSRLYVHADNAVDELKKHIWYISSIEAREIEQEALAKWNKGEAK